MRPVMMMMTMVRIGRERTMMTIMMIFRLGVGERQMQWWLPASSRRSRSQRSSSIVTEINNHDVDNIVLI